MPDSPVGVKGKYWPKLILAQDGAALLHLRVPSPNELMAAFLLVRNPLRGRHAVMVSALAAAPMVAMAQSPSRDLAVAKPAEAAPVGLQSPWMSVGGQLRARAEGYTGGGFTPGNSDSYILTRVLLSARVRPTRGTSLFVEGMDARGPWKNKAP